MAISENTNPVAGGPAGRPAQTWVRPPRERRRVISRLKRLRHYHGWRAVFQALWLYAIRSFMRFSRIGVFSLTVAPAGLSFPDPASTRFATREEAERVGRSDRFPQIGPATVASRWERGHKLLLNIVDGEIAGCGWMNPHELFVEGVDVGFTLHPNEIYIYDAFTLRGYRGQRLGHNRIMFWMRYIKENGKDTVLTDFPFDNPATLTRVDKFGFKRIGTVTRMKWGPFESVRCNGELKARMTRIVKK